MTDLKLSQNRYTIIGLTLLGLGLRFFQLGEWSFWHDEALTVLLARQPVPELVAITASDVHPPLYYLVVKLFLLVGQTEWIVRLPSALWGAGSVAAIYLVGRDLFDRRTARFGAFIMALSPLQLFYAQEARMYTQLLGLTILSVWFLIRALRAEGWGWWAWLGGAAILAAYTAYFSFFVFAAMGLYLLLVDRRRLLYFGGAMAGAGLGYLPWLGVFLSQARAVSAAYWIATPSPLLLFTSLSAFFTGYTLPEAGIIASLIAVLLIIFIALNQARHVWRRGGSDARPLLWLLVWGLVPLLGTYLVSLIRPIFQLRTVLTAAPAFYLLAAWAVSRPPQRRINLLLFLPVVALMLFSGYNFYFNPAYAKPDWRAAASHLQAQIRPGDVVLHSGESSFVIFLCYPHGAPHKLLPLDPEAVEQNAPSQPIVAAVAGSPTSLSQATAGYKRAWLVVGLDQAVEHQAAQKARLDSRYRRLAEENIRGIYLFTYALD